APISLSAPLSLTTHHSSLAFVLDSAAQRPLAHQRASHQPHVRLSKPTITTAVYPTYK
ncbi:hypothetical protein BC827DRAFT_1202392, partial [Russula dissimulans]